MSSFQVQNSPAIGPGVIPTGELMLIILKTTLSAKQQTASISQLLTFLIVQQEWDILSLTHLAQQPKDHTSNLLTQR